MEKNKAIFLRWVLMAALLATGAYVGVQQGLWDKVWEDTTHITLVTLSVFILATLWLGLLCWRTGYAHDEKGWRLHLDAHSWGHFAASACVSIGLIGTVIGYIIASGMKVSGENAAEMMATNVKAGMSIYLVNTALGGICGFFLEVQTQFSQSAVRRAMIKEGILKEEAS